MVVLLGTMVLLSISIFSGSSEGADVDIDWMKTTLLSEFSKSRHHVTDPQEKEAAKTFIEHEFKSYGIETAVHQFNTDLQEVKGNNVIGILKGKKFGKGDDLPVGVGAHYDTVRSTPGVDDNGAGVVALLQAAKTMASPNCKPENTVFFVAFDFEEWEQNVGNISCSSISCGSKALLNDWMPQFLQDNYIQQGLPVFSGAIILDTIMNVNLTDYSQTIPDQVAQAFPDVAESIQTRNKKGDFIAAAGRLGNTAEQMMLTKFQNHWNALSNPNYHVEVFNLPVIPGNSSEQDYWNYYDNFARSDQLRFWLRGFPAIFVTDTANLRGAMETCYHQACDNSNRISDERMDFLAKTAETIIKTLSDLAGLSCTAPSELPRTTGPTLGARTQTGNMLILLSSALVAATISV